MALRSGERLGPYEILGVLGEGGMGQVFRARDTKLDREVAVKVLPPQVAGDAAALARFEREAKAVAALSHPNILAIHDFGTIDGTAFAVTELLDGETLRQRLADGPLGLRKAAEFGSQIARGLGAAHAKGVIHRDLKPENVMITRDGRAKILDFGLAARTENDAADGAGPGGTAGDGKTHTSLTNPGSVMGTVGYMAPEQVRAKPVDARTDIFAFGAVLYEMLTGRRAFQRETNAETLAAVLRDEPPELSASGVAVPPTVAAIVRRCLEKRPEERFHSALDVAFALEALVQQSSPDVRPAVDADDDRTRPAARARRLVAIAVAALLVVAAYAAGRWLGSGAASVFPTRATRFVPLTFESGPESQPAISPDGKSLAYVVARGGAVDIFVKRVGGENAIDVTPGDDRQGLHPAFAPDGASIAYAVPGGGIFVMGATGESARRLTDIGYNPAWSPDGRQIAFATERIDVPTARLSMSKLWRVDVDGGDPQQIPLDGDQDAVQPHWSPDGSRLAFWGLPRGSGRRTLYTAPAGGGATVALTNDDFMNWNPVWSPQGRDLLFTSDRGGVANIWRMPIDAGSGKATGPPGALTVSSEAISTFDVAGDGSTVFAAAKRNYQIVRWPLDPDHYRVSGPAEVVIEGSRALANVAVSPDGQWIAMVDRSGEEDIVVTASDGSGLRRLTRDSFKDREPRWTADSRRLVFFSDRTGRYEAWSVDAEGSGLQQLTAMEGENLFSPIPSPDGKTLYYATYACAMSADLTEPLPTRKYEPLPKVLGDAPFFASGVSSDGTRLAGGPLNVNLDGGAGVLNLADGQYEQFSPPGAEAGFPRFLPDDRTIFYSDRSSIRAADSVTGERWLIVEFEGIDDIYDVNFDTDGRHLYVSRFDVQGRRAIATERAFGPFRVPRSGRRPTRQ